MTWIDEMGQSNGNNSMVLHFDQIIFHWTWIELVNNRPRWQQRVLNASMFNGIKGKHHFYSVVMTKADAMGQSNGNIWWKTFLRKFNQSSIYDVNNLLLLTKKGIKPIYVQCTDRKSSWKITVYHIKWQNGTIQCKNMML